MRTVAGLALQVVASSAIAWLVVLAAAVIWSQGWGGTVADRFPLIALIVGAVWLIGGGNVLSRMGNLSHAQWGVWGGSEFREDDSLRSREWQFTGFAMSIIAGVQLILVGGWLYG